MVNDHQFYDQFQKDAISKYDNRHQFYPSIMTQFLTLTKIYCEITQKTHPTKDDLIKLFANYQQINQYLDTLGIVTVRSYLNTIQTFLQIYQPEMIDQYQTHPEYGYYQNINYDKAVIYVIKHRTDPTLPVYIGSTKNFHKRCKLHILFSRQIPNTMYYLYYFIHQHGGIDNFDIQVLDSFKGTNKKDLLNLEQKWIDDTPNCINKIKTPAYLQESLAFFFGGFDITINNPVTNDFIFQEDVYCQCDNTFKFTKESFDQHTKADIHHINWLNTIKITCGCGENYTYSTMFHHFRRSNHIEWLKQNPDNMSSVLMICRCGVVVRYKDKASHEISSHPNIRNK